MAISFAVVATRGLEAQTAPPPAAPQAPAAAATPSAPPPGPGLVIIKEHCTTCHSTTTIFSQHRTPDDWAATVQLMIDRGADLTPDDMNVVVDYLANNYPKDAAKP